MANIIGKSESTINRIIKELKIKEYIEEKTSDKNGYWIIKKEKLSNNKYSWGRIWKKY